jgi:hypothetical protein
LLRYLEQPPVPPVKINCRIYQLGKLIKGSLVLLHLISNSLIQFHRSCSVRRDSQDIAAPCAAVSLPVSPPSTSPSPPRLPRVAAPSPPPRASLGLATAHLCGSPPAACCNKPMATAERWGQDWWQEACPSALGLVAEEGGVRLQVLVVLQV